MPNKLAHQRITAVILGTAVLPLCAIPLSTIDEYAAFMIGIGLTLRPELGPDMDVSRRRYGFLGELVGLNAYARLMPHRAGLHKKDWKRLRPEKIFFMSHLPLIGTAFRAIMLIVPISIICMIFGLNFTRVAYYAIFLWLGMSLSDLGHVIADLLVSDFKELKRSFWEKRLAHVNRNYDKNH